MWKRQPEVKSSPSSATQPPPAVSVLPSARTGGERLPGGIGAPADDATRLTPGIQIKGDLSGRSDLYIDGEVEGKIRLPQSAVTVGPNGRVGADIEAREIVVQGNMHGKLEGRERVRLGRSSDVQGDVVANRVAIEEGARFRGRIDMAPAEAAGLPHTASEKPEAVEFHPAAVRSRGVPGRR